MFAICFMSRRLEVHVRFLNFDFFLGRIVLKLHKQHNGKLVKNSREIMHKISMHRERK